jgi:hypothetical protein
MEDALPYILPVVALLLLWASHRQNRKRRLIGNLPTSKAQGVFIGLVELSGTVECENPMRSELAGEACVSYNYTVSEQWRRTVQEEYTDEKGNRRTRTRVESGWTVVASGGHQIPFYLEDDTGVVLVQPQGAEIRHRQVFQELCGPMNPLYYGKGPALAIADSTMVRTFSEYALPLHQKIFAVGQSRERQDMVAPELAHDKNAPLYLLTVESEQQLLSRYGWNLWLLNILGIVLAGAAGWLFSQEIGCAIAVGIYLLAWLISWTFMAYNSLVDVRHRVRQGWSNLEVQLKRRHELIPQLISTVQAAREHEAAVQTSLAKLRSQADLQDWDAPSAETQAVAQEMRAIAERYPELQVDENFRQLNAELIATEQRIALARAYFNDIATAYNTRLEQFPDRFLSNFKPQPLLYAEDFERAPVEVQLQR